MIFLLLMAFVFMVVDVLRILFDSEFFSFLLQSLIKRRNHKVLSYPRR